MFACRVHVVSTHEYPTIWVNTNSAFLLNGSRFLNLNKTHLLNRSIMSICLSNFMKMKKKISINQIELLKTKKINIFNIKFRTNE